MVRPAYLDKLLFATRHGPYTKTRRTADDITDMFFGPVKGAWKLIKGVYRYVVGRKTPMHKRKTAFSFNARTYKKNVGALRKYKLRGS